MIQNALSASTGSPVQYCILKVKGKFLSSKVELTVDFGKEPNSTRGYDKQLVEDTQQVTQYYTLVDGLNYMSALGWEIVHAYYQEFSGTTYNNPEYLMKRSISK